MAPCPQVFHGYSAPGGRENGSDLGSRGKRAVRCVAGRASRSPDTSSGTLGTWPDISRVGCVARREACAGGTCPAHARPHVLARNQPAAARNKAISWGPPPCSSIRKGGPLSGWKNRGIFAVGGTGRRGLRLCRHVGQLLAPRPRVSGPHGGRGPLIAGCRCPAGVKGRRGHSAGDREGLGPERVPGKIPSPGPSGSRGFQRLLPWGLVLLTRARVRRR